MTTSQKILKVFKASGLALLFVFFYLVYLTIGPASHYSTCDTIKPPGVHNVHCMEFPLAKWDFWGWHTIHQKAEAGDVNALIILGNREFYGRDTEVNYAKAAAWYEKAAAAGNSNAAMHLGFIYSNGGYGVPKDILKALQYFQQASRLGDTNAAWFIQQLSPDLAP